MNSAQWDIHQEEFETLTAYFTTLFGIDGINLADLPTTSALKCIDIACGPGNLSLELARRGHQVLAVDYSAKMIESLRLKVENGGNNGSYHQFSSLIDPSKSSPYPVECLVANGEDLSVVTDNTFDVAVSNFGIYLFNNREDGFRAAYRVLKPDTGVLIAVTWDGSFVPFVASQKIQEAFPELNKPVSVPDVQTFVNEMKLARFREVKVYSVTHEYICSSGERYVNKLIKNPAVVADIQDPSQQDMVKRIFLETARGTKIQDKVLENSDAYKEPVHYPSTAHICIAIK